MSAWIGQGMSFYFKGTVLRMQGVFVTTAMIWVEVMP